MRHLQTEKQTPLKGLLEAILKATRLSACDVIDETMLVLCVEKGVYEGIHGRLHLVNKTGMVYDSVPVEPCLHEKQWIGLC